MFGGKRLRNTHTLRNTRARSQLETKDSSLSFQTNELAVPCPFFHDCEDALLIWLPRLNEVVENAGKLVSCMPDR